MQKERRKLKQIYLKNTLKFQKKLKALEEAILTTLLTLKEKEKLSEENVATETLNKTKTGIDTTQEKNKKC